MHRKPNFLVNLYWDNKYSDSDPELWQKYNRILNALILCVCVRACLRACVRVCERVNVHMTYFAERRAVINSLCLWILHTLSIRPPSDSGYHRNIIILHDSFGSRERDI